MRFGYVSAKRVLMFFWVLSAFTLGACAPASSEDDDDDDAEQSAAFNAKDNPGVGAVFGYAYDVLNNKGKLGVCTATRVTEDLILTAAHCLVSDDGKTDLLQKGNELLAWQTPLKSFSLKVDAISTAWRKDLPYLQQTDVAMLKVTLIEATNTAKTRWGAIRTTKVWLLPKETNSIDVTFVGFGTDSPGEFGPKVVRANLTKSCPKGYAGTALCSPKGAPFSRGGDSGGPALEPSGYVVGLLRGKDTSSNQSVVLRHGTLEEGERAWFTRNYPGILAKP